MSSSKKGFQSLSDAADLLKNLGKQLAAGSNSPSSSSSSSSAPRSPTAQTTVPPSLSEGIRDIETRFRQRDEARRAAAKNAKRAGVVAKVGKHAKTILKAPGMMEAYRQHLATEEKAQPGSAAPAPEALPDLATQQRKAFERVRALVAKSSPTIETRPEKVSRKTRKAIESAIATGARAYADAPEPDLKKGFIVGFDFGTSSLKLAVRQPYVADDPTAVLPVPPELRSGSHPYLWQTALWFNSSDQSFSLMPGPGFEVLEGFKTGIIGGNGGDRVREDLPVTRSQAAVAFLALQVAHFLGWYQDTRPLRGGGDRPLSINVGIPVAAQDDHRTFSEFRRIVAAAKALVPHASALTLPLVTQTYYAAVDELPAGWELVPELTAAIAGYAASAASQSGSHVLVDVGASTLDIVAFNLLRGERIAVISAAVELLGSASLDFVRGQGVSDQDFERACDYQFDNVFLRQACTPARGADGFSPARRRRDVQLVTTGGGCSNPVHAHFIETMTNPGVLGPLPIVRPKAPAQSVAKKCDLTRLLLAYGLTRDIPELLDLKLPSQISNIPHKRSGPDPYVGPEQT